MRTRFAVLGMAVALTVTGLVSTRASAESGFYTNQCRGCHVSTSTCAGCHAHGVHSSSAKNNLNLSGTTNKSSYVAGEAVRVTVNGGYRSGWVRAILYDQSMVELARSTGPNGIGGGPSFPVVLTAPAPTAPGTYTWNVSWYGNRSDEGGAYFGPRWRPDASNANHGEEIVSTNQFTVSAPAAPVIVLDPPSAGFGTVTVGSQETRQVMVENHGNASLEVAGISRCNGTSSEFGWSPVAPLTVAPGGSLTLSIHYGPTDAGPDSGCLELTSNDPTDPTVNLGLSGTGEAPPPSDPDINLDPTALDFGAAEVGGPPVVRWTNIQNLGSGPLEVTGFSRCTDTSTEFTWTLATPFTVYPGGTRGLAVTYMPDDEGQDSGCLEIESDDPVTPVATVALDGSGVIPPPVAPDIRLIPNVLEFGVVIVGRASTTLDMEVRNVGNGELEVSGISLCPGTSAEFTWAPLAPLVVFAGESAVISVSYTPAGDGADIGCLRFESNDPGSPVVGLALVASGSTSPPVFDDGFMSGDTSGWSETLP